MLAHAFDHLPARVVLVVITADHLLAYALSVLRMRNYQVVLLTSETAASAALISQAAVCFSWNGNQSEGYFAQPPTSPRTQSKGKEKATSREEQGERLTADYGSASSQSGPATAPTLPDDTASTSDAPSSAVKVQKEVDLKDYLPERPPRQEYDENLDEPMEKQLHIPEDEEEIVLNVPDSDEEDLAVAISLSEAELLRQEEEELQLALTESFLEAEGLTGEGADAAGGPVATSSKVTLDSEATSSHEPAATPSEPILSAPHAMQIPGEEPPPAYTTRQSHSSLHFMQPSELSRPSSPATSSLSTLPNPPNSNSLPAQSSFAINEEQEFPPVSPVRSNAPIPAQPAVKEPPAQPHSPLPSSSSNELPTGNLPASSATGSSQASPIPPASAPPTFGPKDIPGHYKVLVDIMEEYRQQGVTSVRRAFLGEQLPKRQPNVYAQAALDGTAKPLKNYVDHAITAGILVWESVEYVSLHKTYIPEPPKPEGTARPGVPPHFNVLLDLMEELYDKGFPTPSRGYLGFILPQRKPDVYASAGIYGASKCPASRKYIDAAIEAGLLKQESDANYVSLTRRKVPGQFANLALVMQQQHARGLRRVNRTLLANEIIKLQPDVYIQAGFGHWPKPMKKYLDSAVEAEILVEYMDNTYSLNELYL